MSSKEPPPREPPGLDAFGKLAERLVQVPKEKLLAEEAKYKAMRERLRKKKQKESGRDD